MGNLRNKIKKGQLWLWNQDVTFQVSGLWYNNNEPRSIQMVNLKSQKEGNIRWELFCDYVEEGKFILKR